MAGTLLKNNPLNNNYTNNTFENTSNGLFLIRNKEKVRTVNRSSRRFLFLRKNFKEILYRKYSLRNALEKYTLEDETGNVSGSMDLKVYKDSVYIIDIDVKGDFKPVVSELLSVASEKALYDTTEKKVYVNLSLPFALRAKFKNTIKRYGFVPAESQSKYEKDMFGEEFVLDLSGR